MLSLVAYLLLHLPAVSQCLAAAHQMRVPMVLDQHSVESCIMHSLTVNIDGRTHEAHHELYHIDAEMFIHHSAEAY